MKLKEKNEILKWAAGVSDKELESEYYSAIYDSLECKAEEMYERCYDPRDIQEELDRVKYDGEKAAIIGYLCEQRGIELWEKEEITYDLASLNKMEDNLIEIIDFFEEYIVNWQTPLPCWNKGIEILEDTFVKIRENMLQVNDNETSVSWW